MKIEVCGSGCSKCAELEKRAKEAVALTGIDATVEHVYDMGKIIERGIFMTPALAHRRQDRGKRKDPERGGDRCITEEVAWTSMR